MAIIVAALVAIAGNILIFAAVRPWLRQERNIFLFHVVSFVLTLLLCLSLAVLVPSGGFAGWVAAGALHGIYSMAFLEFWSVTQGSFFLAVMDGIEANAGCAPIAALEEIGRRKRRDRIAALVTGRLVVEVDGALELSPGGWWIALLFCALRWLMGVRKPG